MVDAPALDRVRQRGHDGLLPNDLGQCAAVVNYTPPVGLDNCPGPVTVQTAGLGSGVLFPVGITTETYQVTDASGNTAQCSFTVTVNVPVSVEVLTPDAVTATSPKPTSVPLVMISKPI